ncbi:hypothetical protein CL648_01255 [bacterium]|nr:hypothetical protein [bacterium]
MGTAFTIDTPLRVAPYGISSVISLCDDELFEEMRQSLVVKHSEFGPFVSIPKSDQDHRAKRITAYLDLIHNLTTQKFDQIRQSNFDTGSEITRYFELLENRHPLKLAYNAMLELPEGHEKTEAQNQLRQTMKMGSIDVNIMTKLDRDIYERKTGDKLPEIYSDAIAGLRGYANSQLDNSSIVFSAGFNRRLFAYIEKCSDFFPDAVGHVKKRIILKVSDFRSSQIQGTFLAKKGVWVYEHRIESGLNCGGHAFATDGLLMGPILAEFRDKKAALTSKLYQLCNQVLANKQMHEYVKQPETRITFQGGIGTYEEERVLLDYYQVDGTGWASPFLLVPEATTVDEATRKQLAKATPRELYLSKISPLGVPFNTMKDTHSETEKLARVQQGKPGSICPKGYLVSNTEFTKVPICTASKTYQRLKVKSIEATGVVGDALEQLKSDVYTKACLCEDLAAPALIQNKSESKRIQVTAVCPGPNIAYFKDFFHMDAMIDHIYGRVSIMHDALRPNVFIKEIDLYIRYWVDQVNLSMHALDNRKKTYFINFKDNLLAGIDYYLSIVDTKFDFSKHDLLKLKETLTMRNQEFSEILLN